MPKKLPRTPVHVKGAAAPLAASDQQGQSAVEVPKGPRGPRTPEYYKSSEIDGYTDHTQNVVVRHGRTVEFPAIKPTDLPLDIVMARLQALDRRIIGDGSACCPAHADSRPSLSLAETADGTLLMFCHAGCTTDEVLAELGLTESALFPSLYAQQFGRQDRGTADFRHGGLPDEWLILPSEETCKKWARVLERWQAWRSDIGPLAGDLGVPIEALGALDVGYDPGRFEWIFPEHDDQRRIVGLLRRSANGSKRAFGGSVRGLSIPTYPDGLPSGPIYLPEGASDTAALFSVGVFAVGRASAHGSPAQRLWLTRLLAQHGDREIIVVGDRDLNKMGVECAAKLAEHLADKLERPVGLALPQPEFKDVREQVRAGAWELGLVNLGSTGN